MKNPAPPPMSSSDSQPFRLTMAFFAKLSFTFSTNRVEKVKHKKDLGHQGIHYRSSQIIPIPSNQLWMFFDFSEIQKSGDGRFDRNSEKCPRLAQPASRHHNSSTQELLLADQST